MAAVDRRAVRRRQIGGVDQILDADRNPVTARVRVDDLPRLHLRLALGDARQAALDRGVHASHHARAMRE